MRSGVDVVSGGVVVHDGGWPLHDGVRGARGGVVEPRTAPRVTPRAAVGPQHVLRLGWRGGYPTPAASGGTAPRPAIRPAPQLRQLRVLFPGAHLRLLASLRAIVTSTSAEKKTRKCKNVTN